MQILCIHNITDFHTTFEEVSSFMQVQSEELLLHQHTPTTDSVVGVCCWSSSPVTLGLRLDSPSPPSSREESLQNRVSHASSVATRSLFYPSFPKTKSLFSLSLLISVVSLSDLLLQILSVLFLLTYFDIPPFLRHLLRVLPLCAC